MSQTIGSVLAILLVQILPMLGVQVDNAAVTTTIQTVVTIVAGLWIWIRRVKAGGVNIAGVRV